MTLKLRPHHILALHNYIGVKAYEEDSVYRSYLEDIYGSSFLRTVDLLAEELFIDNYESIELVSEQDEICDNCSFQESCEKKDYSLLEEKALLAAKKYFGTPLSSTKSFSNPEVLDYISSEVYGFEENKTYNILELFEKLKTPKSFD